MNKKAVGMLAALLAAGILVGCGAEKADKPLKDMDVEKYVTLGEYKGLEVSVEPITVDEDELQMLINNVYNNQVTLENGGITDRAVVTGDTVNIDYEGKKDGVAFEGGTAQGSILTIGSGAFIAGFEDGLIGVMPGETVDLNLTFPENYGNADLAGQAVVFTVTVNFILPEEIDDAIVAEIGIEGVSNGEELHKYAYDYLYSNAENTYNTKLQNAVMDAFMKNCVFEEVPKNMVEKYETAARNSIEEQAKSYGIDSNTFTTYFYKTDFETFVTTYSAEAVKQDMAMQAVANRENLNIDDEELNTTLLEYANNAGYDSVEEYVGETSLEDYREYLLYDKVLQYLVENASVKSGD